MYHAEDYWYWTKDVSVCLNMRKKIFISHRNGKRWSSEPQILSIRKKSATGQVTRRSSKGTVFTIINYPLGLNSAVHATGKVTSISTYSWWSIILDVLISPSNDDG